MHYHEPTELRFRCILCSRIIETVDDINAAKSLAGSKICTKCAPRKEVTNES